MASLYKKPVAVLDPATGRKIKTKSKKWWGQYKDAYGRLKRVPLTVDKQAAQAMLTQLVQRVEREKAGLIDPTEEQRRRPLADHVREFESYLRNKGVSDRQVVENTAKIRKLTADRKWKLIAHITASGVLEFLGQMRRNGLSAQTYNNYLTAIKQFIGPRARRRATEDQQDDRAGLDGRTGQVARGGQDRGRTAAAIEIGLSLPLQSRWAIRRLPQSAALVHHGPCQGGRVAQNGPDAGPPQRHSAYVGAVHARGIARSDGSD